MKTTPAPLLPDTGADSARAGDRAAAGLGAETFRLDRPATVPGEQEHLQRLRAWVERHATERPTSRRDAAAAQVPQHRLQQQVRHSAVDFYHQVAQRGNTLTETAQCLGILPRTLRQWDYDDRPPPLAVAVLGRPPRSAEGAERTAVFAFLQKAGAAVGVARLRQAFPHRVRADLREWLHAYRQEVRQQQRDGMHVLHWQVPGRVWAIDFALPSLSKTSGVLPAIDGQYPYLLAVRDLASGYQLAWLPVAEATAAVTQAVLAELFAMHGTPLVLKADNGPPFRADETKGFLEEAGVFPLFSPPSCPGYNGSIEAAIGSLKRRTEVHAGRAGHPGKWTVAASEAARQQANAGHPERLNGRTPTAVWQQRTPISNREWFRFVLAVEWQRYRACQELALNPEAPLSHWDQAHVDRHAIERALVEHDYLLFTRRRIPLTIINEKVTSTG